MDYMTSLQGYIDATYEELVSAFGDPAIGPNDRGGDKTTCEWEIKDGSIVATVYDWKTSGTPVGMYRWHIGGNRLAAVTVIESKVATYRARRAADTRVEETWRTARRML